MRKHSFGLLRREKGITGLETAIILIAFVVVASVFAFTVLSTGVFSAERSKETIYAGLQEARSSLEPRGAMIAYAGGSGATPTESVYKVSFIVAPAVAGEAIDLTPPYTKDDTSVDPDFTADAEYRTVISYADQNQFLPDVPWTVNFIGEASNDNLLEAGEKAEITVWLLVRNYDVADVAAANALGQWEADSRGASGILSVGGTLLTPNDKFTLEVKPPSGSVMTLQRTLPPRLDTIMDLR
jgi:flagellin FlaB